MSNEKQNLVPNVKKGGWVPFRPDIKILDCTIRDGGLINDHNFDDQFVKTVYNTCVAAGVDYVEFGYKGSKRIFSPSKSGPWKFCNEDDIRRIIGEKSSTTKIAVMADADRTDYHEDILPREKSVIDCVRVACYINQIPLAIDMVKDAHDKGYETMFQLMAVSTVNERDLQEALDIIAKSPAAGVYIVDSFGSLYSEQVRALTRLYIDAMAGTGKEVGFHAHNNQQLAFANTIEAIIHGANRVDASMGGLGRGAGNCPMELLIGFLRNPKFKIRPIYQVLQDHVLPLSRTVEWGPLPQYNITGQLNEHPRSAMAARAGDQRDKFVAFYDKLVDDRDM